MSERWRRSGLEGGDEGNEEGRGKVGGVEEEGERREGGSWLTGWLANWLAG